MRDGNNARGLSARGFAPKSASNTGIVEPMGMGITSGKVMCILILLVFLCAPAVAEESSKVIKVSGTGVVSAKPDRAKIRMHVSHVDKSIVAAKKTVDDKVSRVQKMLLDQGANPADISTSSLSVHEERTEPMVLREGNRDTTRATLYRVSREITAKIESIAKLDVILDSALNLGTNSVQSIEFYSSKIDDIRFEAMRKASDDAGKKAAFLARQFGSRVGKVQQIEYDYKDREVQPYAVALGRAEAPSFLQGTIDVTATVYVVYQIE